ncbi:hypothetical protein EVAR_25606_1 [Eumeta japonica]|uniref:Uncharacterized protein n=1 Tax=Eumeta variegata TaxID=151549 RepID=A0A4C1V0T0_EUMVA|nr:hypothetical protein EVAR_25606_1 [Eumeta japonica]
MRTLPGDTRDTSHTAQREAFLSLPPLGPRGPIRARRGHPASRECPPILYDAGPLPCSDSCCCRNGTKWRPANECLTMHAAGARAGAQRS